LKKEVNAIEAAVFKKHRDGLNLGANFSAQSQYEAKWGPASNLKGFK